MARSLKCANPYCQNRIRAYPEKGNASQRKLYCSRSCYRGFTPLMLRLCKELSIPTNTIDLESKLNQVLDSGIKNQEFCEAFGVSRTTLWRLRGRLKREREAISRDSEQSQRAMHSATGSKRN